MSGPAQEPALKPEELDPKALEAALMAADSLRPACGVTMASTAASVRAYLAQARTVPPAAAPVGDRADLLRYAQAALDQKVGLRIGVEDLPDFISALAAAPVTGYRETAGVEDEWSELEKWAQLVLDQPWNTITSGPDVERDEIIVRPHDTRDQPCVATYVLKAKPRVVLDLIRRVRATPPSGGGDHAAPETGGEAAWVLVPVNLTEDMRRACWEAQYLDLGGNEHEARTLAARRVSDPKQAQSDAAGWAAILAATARPAEAEGSAEVGASVSSVSDNAACVTRNASDDTQAAEPVTSGKLRDDITYIEAALSWYDGKHASADVRSAWKRVKSALALTTGPASNGEGR